MAWDVARVLERNGDAIRKYLCTSDAQWAALLQMANRLWDKECEHLSDERVRTFLLACGYAAAKESGVARLAEVLTGLAACSVPHTGAAPPQKVGTGGETPHPAEAGSALIAPVEARIWLEAMPIPPLKREGNTHVDLALGTIARRDKTDSGIELASVKSPWVCFCEMKWCADISPDVKHFVHRNQLLRVIENALCFQRNGRGADQVFVTLVTPAYLRNAPIKSRLYHYKYEEYSTDKRAILWDLMAASRTDERRHEPGWFYPSSLPERVETLTLRWVTYDDLMEHLPASPIQRDVLDFWEQAETAGSR
jgi:hypothetical protein